MPDYSAGTASVRIRPNADGFIRDLEAKLRAIRDPGFTVGVSADFAQASADFQRFRQLQERNGLRLGVDLDTGKAMAAAEEFRTRESRKKVGTEVEVKKTTAEIELERFRKAQELRAIRIQIEFDEASALGKLRMLQSQFDGVGSKLASAGKWNLGAFGVAAIGPAVTGLAQVAAGIQQVVQAGLALPGVMAGAASSIGTLVVGLSGIKDAYDAVSAASESSGTDQAASARAATQASNQLRNAVVDEAQAQRDVARATADRRRELRDLVLEQRGGMLDESRAILEAQKAREDLMSGNYSDVRDATLRVAEADQRVLEVRARNADNAQKLREENAKGVSQSDSVVAANERLIRSQQQVADAQAAVATASSSGSAAQDKAAAAMANLSPAAQELVQTFIDMKPAFVDVRSAISQPLLEGKAAEFREFFTTVSPTITAGGAAIARGWNENISALFDTLGSDDGRGLMERILGNTADAQGRLTKAIEPAVKGLGTLTEAGTRALPRMADGLTAVFERFEKFITAADEDGRLDEWINEGIDALSSMGNTLLNLGKSFTAITNASGGGFLEWLEETTGKLQTFLNSTEGQRQLKQFFDEARAMFERWKPVLEDIPGLLKGIYDGATTYIGGLMTVLAPVTEFLSNHPNLVAAAAGAYVAFKTIDGITSLLGALGKVDTLLGTGMPNSANKGAKGINAALSKIAIPAALSALLLGQTDGMIGVDQSAASNLGGSALNTAGLAAAGASVAGGPGAIVGAVAGLGMSVYQRVLTDIQKGQAEWEAKWQADHDAGPNRPGSPETANRVTGRNGVLQPSLYNPDGSMRTSSADDLRSRIASGQMPGYSLNAQGQIVGPNGEIIPLPGFRDGGPTPSGRGAGPTGGHLIETHGDEWVLPPQARKAIGDRRLRAWSRGSFEPGGPTDDLFSPANTDPGLTNPVAPNPYQGGDAASIFGKAISGASATVGNVAALAQSLPSAVGQAGAGAAAGPVDPVLGLPATHGASTLGVGPAAGIPGLPASGPVAAPGPGQSFLNNLIGNFLPGVNVGGSATGGRGGGPLPGIWGLLQSGGSQADAWLSQTGSWLADWGSNVLSQAGQIGMSFLEGFWGIDTSSYRNAASQAISHFGGILTSQLPGQQPLGGSGGTDMNSLTAAAAAQGITLTPETMDALYATMGDASGFKVSDLSPAAQRAISYAERHAVGQKYSYGSAGENGRYDCSGIASAIYNAATGQNVRFNTESDFEALGFIPGSKPGALNIGVMRGGGGPNSHMVVTLPNGVNVESGGAHGTTAYGGPAKGASQMPLQWYLPLPQGFFDGGPTPNSWGGVDGKGGHFAVVHPKEFMISARGRATVPDSFLHALNQGMVDPRDLPGFAPGGPINIRAGAVQPPPPRPNFNPGGGARMRLPQPSAPRQTAQAPQQAPAGPPVQTPVQAPPAQQAATPPVAQQPPPDRPAGPAAIGTTTAVAPTPGAGAGGINHNLPALSTLINSGAATIGSVAASAVSSGMGSMGIPGGGLAGQMVQGLVQQGGKIVEDAANVVSSFLVGSVPGSYGGEPGSSPYGRVLRPEQTAPDTAQRGGDYRSYQFNGMDIPRVFQELDLRENQASQGTLAAARG